MKRAVQQPGFIGQDSIHVKVGAGPAWQGDPRTALLVVEIALYLLFLLGLCALLLPILPVPPAMAGLQQFVLDHCLLLGILFGFVTLVMLLETFLSAQAAQARRRIEQMHSRAVAANTNPPRRTTEPLEQPVPPPVSIPVRQEVAEAVVQELQFQVEPQREEAAASKE